jgi:hypothetical protein
VSFGRSGGRGRARRAASSAATTATVSRIEQLFRDVRLGRIHPANRLMVPEIVGKAALGVDPDALPCWG